MKVARSNIEIQTVINNLKAHRNDVEDEKTTSEEEENENKVEVMLVNTTIEDLVFAQETREAPKRMLGHREKCNHPFCQTNLIIDWLLGKDHIFGFPLEHPCTKVKLS